jgi:AcrR family transcriptional regulator
MVADTPELCDTVTHSADQAPPSSLRDARAARSNEAIQTAFLALIERKPLEQITIREIASEAGVHYATFFRHYATKEALLDDVAAEQIGRLVALTVPVLDQVDRRTAVVALCRYVNEHRTLWTALLRGGAAGTMRDELLRLSRNVAIDRAPAESWLPLDLAVSCSVSLIFETLAWWLAPFHGSVAIERVAVMLDRLLLPLHQAGDNAGS